MDTSCHFSLEQQLQEERCSAQTQQNNNSSSTTTVAVNHHRSLELPDSFLQLVAGELDLQTRLGSFACVEQRWRAAAAAATDRVVLKTWQQSRHDALQEWISAHGHGQHITSLELESTGGSMLHSLPCPRLATLSLTCCRVQLAPLAALPATPAAHSRQQQAGFLSRLSLPPPPSHHSAQPKPGAAGILLHASTRLTSLTLHNCRLLTQVQDLARMPALPNLQHLSIRDLRQSASTSTNTDATYDVLHGLLPHLARLTSLDVHCARTQRQWQEQQEGGSAAGLRSISSLSSLRSLQKLSLAGRTAAVLLASAAVHPRLFSLTLLQAPFDSSGSFKFTSLDRLQHLQIDSPRLGDSADAGRLLDGLVMLPGLKQLCLKGCFTQQTPPAEKFSSLCALTSLTSLELSACALPPGALLHTFKQPGRLSNLRILRLACCDVVGPGQAQQPVLRDVAAALVRCCPALEWLEASMLLQLGKHTQALSRLQHLRHLSVSGADKASVDHLTKLTGLTCLHLTRPNSFVLLSCGGLLVGTAGVCLVKLQELFVAGGANVHIKGRGASAEERALSLMWQVADELTAAFDAGRC